MWSFFKRFVLVPALVCGALAYGTLRSDGWLQALTVGILAGLAFTAWTLFAVLAWKVRYDAEQQREAAEAAHEALRLLYAEQDDEAIRQEWEV